MEEGTSFELYALGSVGASNERSVDTQQPPDADAVFYVKLSDMRAVFQFRSDTAQDVSLNDAIFDASSDIRYYVFRKYWPTALNINPTHAMLDRYESSGMLTPNTWTGDVAYAADKSLVKHDFLRYLALHLFNTIHGVDLFRNEEDLRENIAYYGEVARVGIMSVLEVAGTMSANITMSVDNSGNRYSTNDDMSMTNISRELMRQIAVSAPGRLVAIDEAGGNVCIQSVPLVENDTLNFRVVIEASPGQHVLTNVSAIPARTYNIKLIMKNNIGGGDGNGGDTNTVVSDSVSFPNGYPYAAHIYDISASNTSIASAVYADASPPVPIPLIRYGYQGWYYTNSDAWVNTAPAVRNKINWYLSPNNASATVGDLRYVRLNLHVFNRISTPFLTVYTKATGAGDAGGWYKSKRVYVIANSATVLNNNTNYCFYINWNGYSVAPFTVAHNNVELSLTTVGGSAVGGFESSEVLFAYSIGTDSAAARGNVDFILSGVIVGESNGEKEYGYIPA